MRSFTTRLNLVYLLCALVVAAVVAFARVGSFLHRHEALAGHPDLRTGIDVALGLFLFVVVVLTFALWRWGQMAYMERQLNLRMRRLFEAMHNLQDALVVVDRRGRILGCNLQARRLGTAPYHSGIMLHEFYGFMSLDDMSRLAQAQFPLEFVLHTAPPEQKVCRIRSFPSQGMNVVFLSDVTQLQQEQSMQELDSERELIGRIAQGVSHDFNNILCGISGHAALLARGQELDALQKVSLDTIVHEASRGGVLAQQLVDLTQNQRGEQVRAPLESTISRAAMILGRALPEGWGVTSDVTQGLGVPSMPEGQLEQLFIRFGLMLADEYEEPCVVHILARKVGDGYLSIVDARYDAVVFLVAVPLAKELNLGGYVLDTRPPLSRDGGGVIQSVVLSILERHGGAMDVLANPGGYHGYRVSLPFLDEDEEGAKATGFLPPALQDWSVLLAQPATERHEETAVLVRGLGCETELTNNVVGVYSKFKQGGRYQVLIISGTLLGMDPAGTLNRMIQHDPTMAIAVIGGADLVPSELGHEVGLVELPITVSSLRFGILNGKRAAELRTWSIQH
jgi:signal transduction histidine kinase